MSVVIVVVSWLALKMMISMEGISGFLLCKKEVCRSVYLARKKSSPICKTEMHRNTTWHET